MVAKWFKEYFKGVAEDWQKLLSYLKKGIVVWRMGRLKRRAMKLHRKHNAQFFVVKVMGRVRIISKGQFKYLRQHGKLPLSLTAVELKKMAIFYTPARYDKKRVQGAA